MGLKKDAAEKGLEVATDLVKNSMLHTYAGIKQKADEMALEKFSEYVDKLDVSEETKITMLLNVNKIFKKMRNQKAIVKKAIEFAKEGTDFSEKSGVNEDWLDRYMDAAKFVSSEDMQLIWGKILAGEFEKPGSTPPNMIRILSEITPELAQAFQKICSMKVLIREVNESGKIIKKENKIIAPYSFNRKKFWELGISFRILNELDALGVIKYISNNIRLKKTSPKILLHAKKELEIIESYKINHFPAGQVMLTAVGISLCKIIEPVEIEGYRDMLKKYLIENDVEFADINDYIMKKIDGVFTVTKKNNP